jgi:hypothetical protein
MRGVILCLLIIFLSEDIFAETVLHKDSTDINGLRYTLEISQNGKRAAQSVFIVGSVNPKCTRIVYIFHGYKPAGDPYRQNPAYFITNWNLENLSGRYGILFVLPDCGTSVYPVTKRDPFSIMNLLHSLKAEIDHRFKAERTPLVIGFSAGVEGAIKFAIQNGIKEIMAVSGNYDLTNLPDSERAFHEKEFGKGQDVLEKENPITLLKNSGTTIFLFGEEFNRVNVKQAQTLVDAAVPGVKIVDLRLLGKGYSHDWKFLASQGIMINLEKIVSGDTDSLVKTNP